MLRLTGVLLVLFGAGLNVLACGADVETNPDAQAGAGGGSDEGGGASASGGSASGGAVGQAGEPPATGEGGSGELLPPAQGAFSVRVAAPSPVPPGKFCPAAGAGTVFAFEAPDTMTMSSEDEGPTPQTYSGKIIDGETTSSVSCVVTGSSTFTFSGSIQYRTTALSLSGGVVGADGKGTARVTIQDLAHLSGGLASADHACAIDTSSIPGVQSYQIQAGAIWAHFSCPMVQGDAVELCTAEGDFVLENCAKQ